MLTKLLITFLISSQLLTPAVISEGEVLGVQQEAGDKIEIDWPQRIINKNLDVIISASNAIVIDSESEKILYNKNAHQQRSIASITKLMTALTFLDTNPDLDETVQVTNQDLDSADGKANLYLGEWIKLENLLHMSLIASDNHATLVLVRATGMSKEEFVNKMNIKAKGMGLSKTNFSDPVGLSGKNISTAYEVAQIVKLVIKHSMIKKILPKNGYSFTSQSNKYHNVKPTNKLLNSYLNVLGGKTGFIDEAGYCYAGVTKLKNKAEVISVVLNSPLADGRFQDTKALVNWVSENYEF